MCPADKIGAWLPLLPLTTVGAYRGLSIDTGVLESESDNSEEESDGTDIAGTGGNKRCTRLGVVAGGSS